MSEITVQHLCEYVETGRPRGMWEQRKEWFDNGEAYVGKPLTVRYQELTQDGIPRFPVGIAVRDYE